MTNYHLFGIDRSLLVWMSWISFLMYAGPAIVATVLVSVGKYGRTVQPADRGIIVPLSQNGQSAPGGREIAA